MATPRASAFSEARRQLWHLKGFDLFDGLAPAEIESLQNVGRPLRVRRGANLYLPGDPAEHVYALRSGLVKLAAVSSDGREATLALLEAGAILGELEAIEGTGRTHMAIAHSE